MQQAAPRAVNSQLAGQLHISSLHQHHMQGPHRAAWHAMLTYKGGHTYEAALQAVNLWLTGQPGTWCRPWCDDTTFV